MHQKKKYIQKTKKKKIIFPPTISEQSLFGKNFYKSPIACPTKKNFVTLWKISYAYSQYNPTPLFFITLSHVQNIQSQSHYYDN